MPVSEQRVLMLHMPLAVPIIPSLASHLLAAILGRNEISADVFYGTLRFFKTPVWLLHAQASAAEAIFTPLLYEETIPEDIARQLMGCESAVIELSEVYERATKARRKSKPDKMESWPIPRRQPGPDWPYGAAGNSLLANVLSHMDLARICIDRCLAEIPVNTYDIYAFSISFDAQRMASLALAKRLKGREPAAKIVFGGTACDGEMGRELIESFSFIDVVSQGDADLTIVPLIHALRGQELLGHVPGIVYRDHGRIRTTPPAPFLKDLDWLPIPDYSQFLEQLAASDWKDAAPYILFEASRGCWWGEKHHCKFCGLRADGLAYRRKRPQRTREELNTLAARHPNHAFLYATDAILDHRYLKDFFPYIKDLAQHHKWRLFFEIKSNIRKKDIALLSEIGVSSVQPGIESFSDHVLALMDKGCSGLNQIQTIKWLTSYQIAPVYNLIVGTPGETPEDYQQTLELIPLIRHLAPPSGVHLLSLDRFSPYFDRPDNYGISQVRPKDVYSIIYQDNNINLSRLAYKFNYHIPEHDNNALCQSWVKVNEAVDIWKEQHREHGLWWRRGAERVEIRVFKNGGFSLHEIYGMEAGLYEYCDALRSFKEISRAFPKLLPEVLKACLERWITLGWMYGSQSGHYLALAVELDPAPANESSEVEKTLGLVVLT